MISLRFTEILILRFWQPVIVYEVERLFMVIS